MNDEASGGYCSDGGSHNTNGYLLKNSLSNKFVKFFPQQVPDAQPGPKPLQAVIEEQYDNVATNDDDDFFSRDVTLVLNSLKNDWTSEGDLPAAVAKSRARIDLCTNEPIVTPHCGSLPEHYLMSRSRSKNKKKSSFFDVIKSKR